MQTKKQRIICLAPDMVEIVYALGKGDDIVGWSSYTDYPLCVRQRDGFSPYAKYYNVDAKDFDIEEELSHEVATVSKFFDCNYEIIERLSPDIILGSENGQKPLIDELKNRGYNAYLFDYTSLGDVFDAIEKIGDLLGVKEKATSLTAEYISEIKKIKEITKTLDVKKVYFEIAHQTKSEYGTFGPYTVAKDSPLNEMISIAGGENIFSNQSGVYIGVSFDDIKEKNPDYILSPNWDNALDEEITTLSEIKERDGFDKISAVINDNVIYYDSSLMKRFGPRTIIAIKKLCHILHSDIFENPKDSDFDWEKKII